MKKAKSLGTLEQHQSVALAKGLMWILEVKSRLMLSLTASTIRVYGNLKIAVETIALLYCVALLLCVLSGLKRAS